MSGILAEIGTSLITAVSSVGVAAITAAGSIAVAVKSNAARRGAVAEKEEAVKQAGQARIDLAGVSMRSGDLDNLPSFARVLLVEDDRADLHLIRILLEDSPIVAGVVTAMSLAEASTEVGRAESRGDPFQAIIVDPGLAESDGMDTIREAVTIAGNIPVMVLTGRDEADTDFAHQCIRAGVKSFLVKGRLTRADELTRAILVAMRKHRHHR